MAAKGMFERSARLKEKAERARNYRLMLEETRAERIQRDKERAEAKARKLRAKARGEALIASKSKTWKPSDKELRLLGELWGTKLNPSAIAKVFGVSQPTLVDVARAIGLKPKDREAHLQAPTAIVPLSVMDAIIREADLLGVSTSYLIQGILCEFFRQN